MNRSFNSLDSFARFLEKRMLAANVELTAGLEGVAKNTQAHIKSVIGDNTKLAPNAESTIARKGKDAPLEDTGEMRESIVTHVEGFEAGVGTPDEKMYWHEYGLGRNYPERPAMYIGTHEASEENQAIIIAAAKAVYGEVVPIRLTVDRLGGNP